jgi:GMP synthase-like glutamine amidotransferase
LPEYQSDQAKFGDLLAKWAGRDLTDATFTVVNVVEGETLPSQDAFDGFIISGSDKGVYDDTPWMQPLRDWMVTTRAAGKPMFGVCFGHQIMADVFGGKAEKVGDAEVGVRSFDVMGETLTGHVWHQDQVTQVPQGATVICSADYCPVAALAYDFPAMSVQFHPEYAPEYVSTFLRRSRGVVLSEQVTDDAVAQFDASDVSSDLFAKQVGDFFRSHQKV